MRTNLTLVAVAAAALMIFATAAPAAQRRTTRKAPAKKKTVARGGEELGLVGIKLYDSGTRIVAMFGSPDSIEAVGTGGGSVGPAGARGGGGARGGTSPAAGAGAQGAATINIPDHSPSGFDFGNEMLSRQAVPPGDDQEPVVGGPGTGRGSNRPGAVGPGGGPGGGGGGLADSGDRVIYTRWVYNRGGSKYGFILDKFSRVVQCEAIGIQNGKVRTRRGVGFGSTFATIVKRYGAPDGYEISGDNLTVRYLSKAKCAFRMSRLGQDKPQVVTGIVVAAGKR